MTHTGILAQNIDGGAACFVTYCRAGVARLGGHTYPDVTLDYIGFGHSLTAARTGDYRTIRATLDRSVAQLAAAGADFFFCADNTAHLVLDMPGPDLVLPGLHIAQIVAAAAGQAGNRKVGLLGTAPLVNSPIYPTWMGSHGIDTVAPEPADADDIDRIIFTELVNGITTDDSRQRFLNVIDTLAQRGCDAIALVSTEIPTLITPEASTLPVLDSAKLAAEWALEVAVGDRPLPTWRGGPHPDLKPPR